MHRPLFAINAVLVFLAVGQSHAAPEASDVAGIWDSDWGLTALETTPVKNKKTLAVSGSYIAGKDQTGLIKFGTFDPATGVLEFTFEEPWRNASKGSASLKITADGKRMKGTYRQGDEKGDWSMTRLHGDTFAERADSIVANAGVHTDTPGAAVLVIEGGKVVFEKGYGLAIVNDNKPITPRTTFELASCSKQFTGTAILKLYEQGKLKLDDDVRKYLPELPEYDKKNPIRIWNLARHTSGLPEYMDFENVKGKNPNFVTNEDLVGEFARQRKKLPLRFPTGEKFEYRNSNYMLLALIVERVSKSPFSEYLKTEIFQPFGMETACVYDSPDFKPSHPAIGYKKHKDKYEDLWGPAPHAPDALLAVGDGSIWVSLRDMIKWDEAWRAGKVLKPETIKYALVPSKTDKGKDNDYAFGWGVRVEDGKLLNMEHNGGWGGFRTIVRRNIAEQRTIVVLSNFESVDSGAISNPLERLCRAMPPGAR
jgi:CubicO group peptidase (beta-lactamase class C family)